MLFIYYCGYQLNGNVTTKKGKKEFSHLLPLNTMSLTGLNAQHRVRSKWSHRLINCNGLMCVLDILIAY